MRELFIAYGKQGDNDVYAVIVAKDEDGALHLLKRKYPGICSKYGADKHPYIASLTQALIPRTDPQVFDLDELAVEVLAQVGGDWADETVTVWNDMQQEVIGKPLREGRR